MLQHRPALAAALAAAVFSSLLVASGPTATASDAAPTKSERVSAQTKYQRTAFRVTNDKRENHGRKALKRNECLQKYAVKNARRMARREDMRHQKLRPIQRDCGVGWVGENIAEGYPNGRAVVNAWMRSKGHRANILSRKYRLMGLAARKGDNGRWYAAQVFGRKT